MPDAVFSPADLPGEAGAGALPAQGAHQRDGGGVGCGGGGLLHAGAASAPSELAGEGVF